jgi:hypothetical protein
LVGRASGGGNTPANLFRGGAARGLSDFTVNGAPGVKSSGSWVWCDQRIMRNLLGAKAGLGDALGCARGGGGGFARRRTLACGVPVPTVT